MMAVDRFTTASPDEDILGDWNAPEGSEPWCKALRLSLQSQIKSIGTVPEKIRWYVERAIANRAWVHWLGEDGEPFRDFDDFCSAKPPHGLGRPFSEIRPYIEAVKGSVATAVVTAPVLDEHGGQRAGAGRPGDARPQVIQVATGKLDSRGGNASSYLAARIARDAPEVAEQMKAGAFKSVRAAALKAGIVKAPDPVKVARRELRRASAAQPEGSISSDLRGAKMVVRGLTREEQGQLHEWLGKELGLS